MRRTLLVFLAIAAIVVPSAAYAGMTAREPWQWGPTPQTAGDIYRYQFDSTSVTGDETETSRERVLLAYEGVTVVLDAYGRPQSTDTYVFEYRRENEELISAARCHNIVGGTDIIRHEYLAEPMALDGNGSSVSSLGGVVVNSRTTYQSTELPTSFDFDSCNGAFFAVTRNVTEGARYPYSLFAEPPTPESDPLSQPATRAEFEGRRALRIAYPVASFFDESPDTLSGHIAILIAEGIPVIASYEIDITDAEDGMTDQGAIRLEGITWGAGAARAPTVGATLTPPSGLTKAWDPLALDDTPFNLAYTYAEAIASMRADTGVAFSRWLAAHPDAYLFAASYDRGQRRLIGGDVGETDGGWMFSFRSGDEQYHGGSTRTRAPHPALAGLPVSTPVTNENWEASATSTGPFELKSLPTDAARSEKLAEIAAAHGFPLDNLQRFAYHVGANQDGTPVASMSLSEVGSTDSGEVEGRVIWLDALDGGATALGTTTKRTERSGILEPNAGQGSVASPDGSVSALSILVGPAAGAGLAGGAAATGLALLFLIVKFGALPFFTRLVKDRLLDNPVRARIYDRVRQEAGIRRSELIDYAGVGEGATRRHLDQLVKHNFLVELRDNGIVAYYAAGDVPPAIARRAAILRSASTRRVYDLLSSEPGLTLREAGARLDMSAPGVHRIKKKLEGAGLLPALVEVQLETAEA